MRHKIVIQQQEHRAKEYPCIVFHLQKLDHRTDLNWHPTSTEHVKITRYELYELYAVTTNTWSSTITLPFRQGYIILLIIFLLIVFSITWPLG